MGERSNEAGTGDMYAWTLRQSKDSTSPTASFSDRGWTRNLTSDIYTKPKHKNGDSERSARPLFLFVKVYLEGMPIGRKVNLYAIYSYNDLLATLSNMFGITVYSPGIEEMNNSNCSMLVYEDIDGDWLLVGDVPWELFLVTVKRLKITNPYCWARHRCYKNNIR